ncbi:MAG: GNAT family N-acetyltransferase [Dissulfurispiraceae bacterium]
MTKKDAHIVFKLMTMEDIPVVQDLARHIWEEAYSDLLSQEQIHYMLTLMYSSKVISDELSGGAVWEIIFQEGTPCGYVSYSISGDDAVQLSKIYIEKSFRGKSIAEEAIKRVLRYAAEKGKARVFLTVNKGNVRAIRAYEKNGFSVTDSVVKDIGNGFVMDDYVMSCFSGHERATNMTP